MVGGHVGDVLEQKGKCGEKSIIKAEVSEELLVTVLPSSASCLHHLPFLQLYPRTRHFFLHCTSYIWILNHAGLKKPNKLGCICAWSIMSDSVIQQTVAYQAPQSMGFSRQAYWIGLPFPPPEDLPYPGIKPRSPALAGRFFTTEPPGNQNLAEMWLKIWRPKERIIRSPWNRAIFLEAVKDTERGRYSCFGGRYPLGFGHRSLCKYKCTT